MSFEPSSLERARSRAAARAIRERQKQHPRMLRIGELEDESEFPTPTGRQAMSTVRPCPD
jgi:hypothetical protein